jgi:multidrug efflux system outer membrane protein
MKSLKKLIVAAGVLLFSSCLVGPKYERPASVSPPGAYRNADTLALDTLAVDSLATDSIAAMIRWDSLFNDPVLKSLVDSVLSFNPDLTIAAARIQEAEAQYKVNRATPWPEFYYSAGASRFDFNDVNGKVDPQNRFTINAGINWELDFWGKYRHATRAAQNQLLASQEGYRAVRNTLGALTLTLYFQLRDLDARLLIAERTLKARQEYYDIIKARFEGGDVAELDKFQSEQQLAIAEAAIPSFRRQINLLENNISVLLGKSPGPIIRGRSNYEQPEPDTLPPGLPSTILERRPDVKQAEYRYISEIEKIGIYQAQRFPAISLTGVLGLVSPELSKILTDDAAASSISGSLFGPIFSFGKYKRRVEQQRKVAEQARENYRLTYLNALADVADAIITVSTSKDEHSARERQSTAAIKALTLSKARYDNGYTTYLEVLDAQRSLFDAELQESITRQQQLNATVELYRALGGSF